MIAFAMFPPFLFQTLNISFAALKHRFTSFPQDRFFKNVPEYVDRRGGKEIMKNIMGMIPQKVMKKPNSKYNGAVLENLNSQIFGTPINMNNIKDKEQVT